MTRIVFDLDGTLIDSAPDIRGVANAILAEDGQPEVTLDQVRSFIGKGTQVFIQRLRAAQVEQRFCRVSTYLEQQHAVRQLCLKVFGVDVGRPLKVRLLHNAKPSAPRVHFVAFPHVLVRTP